MLRCLYDNSHSMFRISCPKKLLIQNVEKILNQEKLVVTF